MQINDLLEKAVEREIISRDQRHGILALEAEASEPVNNIMPAEERAVDGKKRRVSLDEDEVSRLVGGGNDVFVTIGVVLLLVGGRGQSDGR